LDIGVLGYIGIVWPKEHSPEVWSVPPVTLCIIRRSVIRVADKGLLIKIHLISSVEGVRLSPWLSLNRIVDLENHMVDVDDEIGEWCDKPNVRGPPRGPLTLGFQGHYYIWPTYGFQGQPYGSKRTVDSI